MDFDSYDGEKHMKAGIYGYHSLLYTLYNVILIFIDFAILKI